jgi:hypothetical protein
MGEAGTATGGFVEPQGGRDSRRHVYEHIYGVWMADYNIQCARAGMAGTIAWDLDDAMHTVNGKESDRGDLHHALFKKWGFWNSLANEIGHPEDLNIRLRYYTWSLMSRSFPPGCTTVKTSETFVPGLRTLAAKTAAGDFAEYDYLPGAKLVDKDGFPVAKCSVPAADFQAGANVSLPARSVVILTTVR